MMNTRYCHNCGGDKTSFESPFCDPCQTAVNEAREGAVKEGTDPGQAQRTALWQRGHNPNRNRADSRTEIQRVQFNDFVDRLNVVPGSEVDPRRGKLPS